MTKRTMMSSLVVAAAMTATNAHADVTISDFSNFELSGTYEEWGWGTFSPGPDDFRVEASSFGGGWKFMDAAADASAENQLELIVTANPSNEATSFNVIMFSGAGATQAGFSFTIVDGLNTYVADLNNPHFFNAGDINSWDTSDLWDQWHLQGSFANSDLMDLTFDDFTLTANGQSDCFRMQVSALTAGQYALWQVGGATPGEQVVIVWGTDPGQTNVNGTAGFCASFGIKGINQKRVLARKVVDNAGTMLHAMLLPGNTQGMRLLTQAAQSGTCPDPCSSNLDDQVIQ